MLTIDGVKYDEFMEKPLVKPVTKEAEKATAVSPKHQESNDHTSHRLSGSRPAQKPAAPATDPFFPSKPAAKSAPAPFTQSSDPFLSTSTTGTSEFPDDPFQTTGPGQFPAPSPVKARTAADIFTSEQSPSKEVLRNTVVPVPKPVDFLNAEPSLVDIFTPPPAPSFTSPTAFDPFAPKDVNSAEYKLEEISRTLDGLYVTPAPTNAEIGGVPPANAYNPFIATNPPAANTTSANSNAASPAREKNLVDLDNFTGKSSTSVVQQRPARSLNQMQIPTGGASNASAAVMKPPPPSPGVPVNPGMNFGPGGPFGAPGTLGGQSGLQYGGAGSLGGQTGLQYGGAGTLGGQSGLQYGGAGTLGGQTGLQYGGAGTLGGQPGLQFGGAGSNFTAGGPAMMGGPRGGPGMLGGHGAMGGPRPPAVPSSYNGLTLPPSSSKPPTNSLDTLSWK